MYWVKRNILRSDGRGFRRPHLAVSSQRPPKTFSGGVLFLSFPFHLLGFFHRYCCSCCCRRWHFRSCYWLFLFCVCTFFVSSVENLAERCTEPSGLFLVGLASALLWRWAKRELRIVPTMPIRWITEPRRNWRSIRPSAERRFRQRARCFIRLETSTKRTASYQALSQHQAKFYDRSLSFFAFVFSFPVFFVEQILSCFPREDLIERKKNSSTPLLNLSKETVTFILFFHIFLVLDYVRPFLDEKNLISEKLTDF